jgi:hypothetical protein
MTPRDVENDISALVSSLLEAKLAVDSNPVGVHRRGNLQYVTWPSALDAPPVDPEDFASVKEYRELIRSRFYTCLLIDGSFLQLGYTFHRDELRKHRLCFYPSPIALRADEYEPEMDVGEIVDFYLDDELAAFRSFLRADDEETGIVGNSEMRLRMRSPVRFDFDLDNQAVDHPGSHLHISHEECRWPVFGPLSVGHFARFVFRHFYPDLWSEHEFLRSIVMRSGNRSITVDEERELFIDCRVGL